MRTNDMGSGARFRSVQLSDRWLDATLAPGAAPPVVVREQHALRESLPAVTWLPPLLGFLPSDQPGTLWHDTSTAPDSFKVINAAGDVKTLRTVP